MRLSDRRLLGISRQAIPQRDREVDPLGGGQIREVEEWVRHDRNLLREVGRSNDRRWYMANAHVQLLASQIKASEASYQKIAVCCNASLGVTRHKPGICKGTEKQPRLRHVLRTARPMLEA